MADRRVRKEPTRSNSVEDNEHKEKRVRTDYDALRDHHKFLRSEKDDDGSWESKLARSYYTKLYKEYVIVDSVDTRKRRWGCGGGRLRKSKVAKVIGYALGNAVQ